MRLTVPANLLLLGEYAVLEEGGIGVALAVEPRITATLTQAPRLELAGRWLGGRTVWAGEGDSGLFGHAVEAVAERLGATTSELRTLPLRVEVDSTPFYDASGGKRGFGSSAATAVAVCYALLVRAAAADGRADGLPGAAASGATGPLPPRTIYSGRGGEADSHGELLDSTFACALRAHRAFQGGRGSGYDVAVSVYGGIGRFEGGAAPHYVTRPLPWLPPLTLVRGSSPVTTKDAVARYRAWKTGNPRRAARFLERSNECAEAFLTAGSWTEAQRWVESARALSIELGSEIGTPAAVPRPAGFAGIVKAVGAGDELGVAFGDLAGGAERPGGPGTVRTLTIVHSGVGGEPGGSGSGDGAS